MRLIRSIDEFDLPRSVAALGTFDGLHIGHARLVSLAVERARACGAASVVCAFDRHPLALLCPARAPEPLMSRDERAAMLERMGVDVLVEQRFDERLAATGAEDYARALSRALRPVELVVGANHTFGAHGVGNPELLARLGGELGFTVMIVPAVEYGGKIVSSTRVREALAAADTALASALLGRERER